MQAVRDIINEWKNKKNIDSELNLSGRDLSSLDFIINDIRECTVLRLDWNYLKELPDLPNCKILSCSANKLTKLPDLLECVDLNCSKNLLTELPELPKCEKLQCGNNKISQLPKLDNVIMLSCHDNPLKELPKLPNCTYMRCAGCKLKYLPRLPQCYFIDYIGNPLLWLPQLNDDTTVYCVMFSGSTMIVENRKFSEIKNVVESKEYLRNLIKFNRRGQIDMITINYKVFAGKIKKVWIHYKRKKVFKVLHENYIKNVSTVISQYVV